MNATPLRSLILVSLLLIPELLHATDFSGPNLPSPAPPPPAPGVEHDVSVNQPDSLVSINEPGIHPAVTSDFPHLHTIQSGSQPMIMVNPCSPVTGMMQTGPMVVQGSTTSSDLHALTRFRPSRSLADSRNPALFYRYTQERREEAKILMHFPHGTNPTVAINFAEYPGEGDFRIFRTVIPAGESRKYYLKAFGKGRVELGTGSSSVDTDPNLAHYPFVTLRGGDNLKLAFAEPQDGAPTSEETTLDDLKAELKEIRSAIEELKKSRNCAQFPSIRFTGPESLQAHVTREGDSDDGKILRFGFPHDPTPQPIELSISKWCSNLEDSAYSCELILTLCKAVENDMEPVKYEQLPDVEEVVVSTKFPKNLSYAIDYDAQNATDDYFGIGNLLTGKEVVGKEIYILAKMRIGSKLEKDTSKKTRKNITVLEFETVEPLKLTLEKKTP